MLLQELFTKFDPNKMTVVNDSSALYGVIGTVGKEDKEELIQFEASAYLKDRKKAWIVDFSKLGSQGRNYELTNSRNEFEVFQFVIEAMRMFIAAKKPNTITFSASKSDGDRFSLYKRLAMRLKGDYVLDIEERENDHLFVLRL